MSLYLISSFAIYSVNMDLCILCDAFFFTMLKGHHGKNKMPGRDDVSKQPLP